MEGSSNALLCASITNVSNFVSEILSGKENYHLWKAQMVCLLKSKNMYGIVDATFVRPGDFGKETMIQYDNLVKGWIFGSVSKDVLVVVFDLGSAKDVWEKLKAVYDPTTHLHEASTSRNSDAKTQKEEIEEVSVETSTKEEAANEIDIVASQDALQHLTETHTEDMTKLAVMLLNKFLLHESTIKGDWWGIEQILTEDASIAMKAIGRDGSTVLHIAVGTAHNNMVKKLVETLNVDQVLKQRDSDGSTALHVAAFVGNKYAAELLVKKNGMLLHTKDAYGKEPLDKAYENMHLYTLAYLLKAINDDDKTKLQSSLDGSVHPHPHEKVLVDLLLNAISAKQYSLASKLVEEFPRFASKSDNVLMSIAKNFPSGLDYGEALIYPCQQSLAKLMDVPFCFFGYFIFYATIIIDYIIEKPEFSIGIYNDLCSTVPLLATLPVLAVVALALLLICLSITFLYGIFLILYPLLWKGAKILWIAPIKRIENKKKEWDEAKKLLELVCDEIDMLENTGTHHPYYTGPILEAACHNAFQVVDEILSRSSEAIRCSDKNGYGIIQLAIMNRSENIYNLIYDTGERKNLYRTYTDSSKNNILHLPSKLAPSNVLNQRTGAALQLQRELQWRDEVKKLVFPTYTTQENDWDETPNMIFTRDHKDLVKKGEEWMKSTAESCSITAALITTIVFAAAITVPGGSNQEKGTPLFKKNAAFIVFAVADAISLFASSTALLVFLSILTARFAENDFLLSLPSRLFIGLFSLVLSTTAMMVAFSATLFLVFCDEKLWMLAPICGLAFIPIAFFVGLQFPLMVDLFRSTYIGVLGKKEKTFTPTYHSTEFDMRFRKYIKQNILEDETTRNKIAQALKDLVQ